MSKTNRLRSLLFVPLALAGVVAPLCAQVSYEPIASIGKSLTFTGPLVQGRDGPFYGVSSTGGRYNGGAVFRVWPDGKTQFVHCFRKNDRNPFDTNENGYMPEPTLVVGQDGSVYGATRKGGIYGCGTLYRIDASGDFEVCHSFLGTIYPDHSYLEKSELLMTPERDLYGIYEQNGVFRFSTEGEYSIAWNPEVPQTQGHWPASGPHSLTRASDGSLYVTTNAGGVPFDGPNGEYWFTNGMVCKIEEDPTEYTEIFISDKDHPAPKKLVERTDGKFYGLGNSKLVTLAKDGSYEEFQVPGQFWWLSPANDGKFYGLSSYSPTQSGLLQLDAQGELTNISILDFPQSEGWESQTIQGADGRLYGLHNGESLEMFRLSVPGLTPSNLPPMARNDIVSLKKLRKPGRSSTEYEVFVDVLKNDEDADNDTLSISEISTPEFGTVSYDEASRQIRYVTNDPQADQFTYTVSDGKGGTSTADVRLQPRMNPRFEGELQTMDGIVGTMKLAITPSGRVGGFFKVADLSFRFSGHLNSYGKLTVRYVDRIGWKRFFSVHAWPEGENWKVAAAVNGDTLPFEGICLPK